MTVLSSWISRTLWGHATKHRRWNLKNWIWMQGSLAGLSVLLYCQSSASIKWLEILSHCSALNPHLTSTHRSVPAVNQMSNSCSGLTRRHQTALKVRDVSQANVIIPFTPSELKSSRHDGSSRLRRGGDSHPSSLIKSIYHNDLFKVSSPHPAALLKARSR